MKGRGGWADRLGGREEKSKGHPRSENYQKTFLREEGRGATVGGGPFFERP